MEQGERRSLAPNVDPDDRVVLFDGVCRLCGAWARFLIRFDRVPGRTGHSGLVWLADGPLRDDAVGRGAAALREIGGISQRDTPTAVSLVARRRAWGRAECPARLAL